SLNNGFSILPPAAGYVITVCHYFFWVGFLPSKYRRGIAQFLNDGSWDDLLQTHLGWIAGSLRRYTRKYVTLRDDQWTVQPGIPEPIFRYPRTFWTLARTVLVAKACWRSPIKGVRSMVRIVGAAFQDVTKPQGRILAV